MTKRYLIAAAAHNLGRILRKLFGIGKPRVLQGDVRLAALVQLLVAWLRIVLTPFPAPNVCHYLFIRKITYPTFNYGKTG